MRQCPEAHLSRSLSGWLLGRRKRIGWVGWAKISGKELSNERNKAINFQARRRLLQYDAVRARLQSLIMESTSEALMKARDKHREAVRLQQYYSAKIGVAVERLT